VGSVLGVHKALLTLPGRQEVGRVASPISGRWTQVAVLRPRSGLLARNSCTLLLGSGVGIWAKCPKLATHLANYGQHIFQALR
jgi:hypothetical protein